jgi:crossover junction endodeoxyribonuclease RuvC
VARAQSKEQHDCGWVPTPEARLVLGIDPGTAIMGYGLIAVTGGRCAPVAYGAIRTPKDMGRGDRLLRIYEGLTQLLDRYHPHEVACEQLFFSRNVTTAMAVGEARGIVLMAAAQRGLASFEYTPTAVKQALSGSGRADKAEVGQTVAWSLELDEIPRPDDVADALAIALCHVFHGRLGGAVAL